LSLSGIHRGHTHIDSKATERRTEHCMIYHGVESDLVGVGLKTGAVVWCPEKVSV